jgi:hypothetical protein
MTTMRCPACRGSREGRLIRGSLPIGGAEVLQRVAEQRFTDTSHVVIYLADCQEAREFEEEASSGMYMRVPDGARIGNLSWPWLPSAECRGLPPPVVLWGGGIPRDLAEAAARELVRVAYDRVRLWLGRSRGTPVFADYEGDLCRAG